MGSVNNNILAIRLIIFLSNLVAIVCIYNHVCYTLMEHDNNLEYYYIVSYNFMEPENDVVQLPLHF